MATAQEPQPSSAGTIGIDQLTLGQERQVSDFSEAELDAALEAFEATERARLGIEEKDHYVERVERTFTATQRDSTTILVGGLTLAQDTFIEASLKSLGYHVRAVDVPDNDALRIGKEFGNRGQCNPTYFTVGNLVKHLITLRDEQGMSTQEIIDSYLFMTAGACGPCRFGTYVTEYRKALRDAGFDGFRVMLFQQQGGLKQATGDELGLKFNMDFFKAIVSAFLLGDVLNAMTYRVRPYEIEAGATDHAHEEAKRIVSAAYTEHTSMLRAMWKVRRMFSRVKVDRTRVKPKVSIIGEFWAMTTEGDGNYKMQRFLEQEGAEVDVQLLSAWLLFMIWENRRDTELRMALRHDDEARKGLEGKNGWKKVMTLRVADKLVRCLFQGVAKVMGLKSYTLPDMWEVARVAEKHYNNELRGGEAHMEVGKLILNVEHSKVNMTLSIKPFGCMPSSGVSDGVQSTITEMYPSAIYLPIETTGDGAVNVQSRVQMMLFKARQQAQREYDDAMARWGLTQAQVDATLRWVPMIGNPLFKARHYHGSTAADTVELVGRIRHPLKAIFRAVMGLFKRSPRQNPAMALPAA